MDILLKATILVYICLESVFSLTECPADGFLHASYCFMPMDTFYQVSWTEGARICASEGATLPNIPDSKTQDALKAYIESLQLDNVWLGLNAQPSLWRWVKDLKIIGQQGCYIDSAWSGRDLPHRIDVSPVTPMTCINDCRLRGYIYAGVQNTVECHCGHSFGKYGPEVTDSWCNLPCRDDPTQTCGGWNRNMIYYVNGTLGEWSYLEPDNKEGSEFCGALEGQVSDGGSHWKFIDQNCSNEMGYICSIDNSCPEEANYFTVTDRCIYVGEARVTWYLAREDCLARGGDLLLIDSVNFQQGLAGFLSDNGDEHARWIGITRVQWTWQTGDRMEYSNWNTESPRYDKGCGQMSAEADFNWIDRECGQNASVICQYEYTQPSPITTSILQVTSPMTRVSVSPEGPLDGTEQTHDGDLKTGLSSGGIGEVLSLFQMILIGALILLSFVIVIAIVTFVAYKEKEGHSQVHPSRNSQVTGKSETHVRNFRASGASLEQPSDDTVGLFTTVQSVPVAKITMPSDSSVTPRMRTSYHR